MTGFHADAGRISGAIGIGLRAPHAESLLSTRPALGWLEIHAENYFGGGAALRQLDALRRDYPLSLHGVGLSLGSDAPPDAAHLARLKRLMARSEPFLVSEHLSWSSIGGAYFNDLLPLPYTEEALARVSENVAAAQDALGRRILIENPSRYLAFRHSTLSEEDFLNALARRTGCGLLCDVNNIFVSCSNLGRDAAACLAAFDRAAVGEIHLAGHSLLRRGAGELRIDDHSAPVCAQVWELYAQALARFGLVPSLVEWDRDLPALEILLAEAGKAREAARHALLRHAEPV